MPKGSSVATRRAGRNGKIRAAVSSVSLICAFSANQKAQARNAPFSVGNAPELCSRIDEPEKTHALRIEAHK